MSCQQLVPCPCLLFAWGPAVSDAAQIRRDLFVYSAQVDTEAIPEKDKAKMQEQRGGLRLLEKIGKIPSGGGRKKVANVKVSVEGRGLVIKDTNGT